MIGYVLGWTKGFAFKTLYSAYLDSKEKLYYVARMSFHQTFLIKHLFSFALIVVLIGCNKNRSDSHPDIKSTSLPTPTDEEYLLPVDLAKSMRLLCQGSYRDRFQSLCAEQKSVEAAIQKVFGGLTLELSGRYFITCFVYSEPNNRYFGELLVTMPLSTIETILQGRNFNKEQIASCLALASWYKKAVPVMATHLGISRLPMSLLEKKQ